MSNDNAFDSKQFRKALGSFVTGVTVVTTRGADGKDAGLTANSFNSASLTPPMVLWSLDKKSSNFATFMETDHFAVHILAAGQEAVSNQFAKSGTDRFAGLQVERGAGQVPLLDGCAARFQCRTTYRYEGGDHIIFVGEVLSFDSTGHAPLAFHGGRYGRLQPPLVAVPTHRVTDDDDFLGFMLRRAYAQLMMPLLADVRRRGLNDLHRSILTVLSMGDGRSVAEVSRLVEIGGHLASEEHFQDLAMQGLITIDHGMDGGVVRFTEAGRQCAGDHMVAKKTAETDATHGFTQDEVQLLKNLLQRVIGNTAAGLPDFWRKENFWRDNNIWGATPANAPEGAGVQP